MAYLPLDVCPSDAPTCDEAMDEWDRWLSPVIYEVSKDTARATITALDEGYQAETTNILKT